MMTKPELNIFRDAASFRKKPLLEFLKHRLNWTLGNKQPLMAYLKVTKRCNLDCYYCPWHAPANDFLGELGTLEWLAIIEDLHKQGVRLFILEGGEPTVRDDLSEILGRIHELKCHSVLATNCTARNPWKYEPTVFTTSIDGPQDVHDGARGVGSYKKVIKRLRQRTWQRIFAITVITTDNAGYLEDICRELSGLVTGHLFTFLYPYSNDFSKALTAAEIKKVKEVILSLKKNYFVINPKSFLTAPLNQQSCHDDLTISVDHTGSLKRGCFVQHVEPKNCDACELACFHLVSAFHTFNLEAWFNLNRFILDKV